MSLPIRKRCTLCLQWKNREEFLPRRKGEYVWPATISSKCKDCVNEIYRVRYSAQAKRDRLT